MSLHQPASRHAGRRDATERYGEIRRTPPASPARELVQRVELLQASARDQQTALQDLRDGSAECRKALSDRPPQSSRRPSSFQTRKSDERPRPPCFGQTGLPTSGPLSTFRSAISCCAVIAIFADRATRGVHPRFNCAARKPDNTANSNAVMPVGRRIMAASVASATLTHSKALVRTLAGVAEDSKSRRSVYSRSVISCYLLF